MQIGIDARLVYHQPAGISRYTRYLMRAISEINRDDDFIVFQHRRHTEPLISKPNFRRATLFAPVHTRLEQLMLPLELMRFSLDLLHSTDFIPPLHASLPTVITVHDLAFLHWPHFLTKDSAAYYGQIDRGVRRASHIIVPSESTKKDLIAQLGVPKNKVSVIYEAADGSFGPLPVEPTRRQVCQRYGLPDTFFLFVGTIEPRKNVDGLLRAFRHLLDKYNTDNVGLAIAGGRMAIRRSSGFDPQAEAGAQRVHVRARQRQRPPQALCRRTLPRSPCSLRRLRTAAPRSHGLRHADYRQQRQQPARSRRRCRPFGKP